MKACFRLWLMMGFMGGVLGSPLGCFNEDFSVPSKAQAESPVKATGSTGIDVSALKTGVTQPAALAAGSLFGATLIISMVAKAYAKYEEYRFLTYINNAESSLDWVNN